ncbi:hypothetical protein DQP58_03225 [Mycobacterium colombiense]|uniref:Uncharacterized protein n=1 Tax=Mycobacterium colombiense TaxID=339268 RepID=A0A329KV87_9MYCO|nr:hypothetical protein DQP58_03225 [Mycobacterium colombiense]
MTDDDVGEQEVTYPPKWMKSIRFCGTVVTSARGVDTSTGARVGTWFQSSGLSQGSRDPLALMGTMLSATR